jgi:hypothetical protein
VDNQQLEEISDSNQGSVLGDRKFKGEIAAIKGQRTHHISPGPKQ